MDAAVVRQLLDFFQDFLNLCQSNWPDNSTTEDEIKNAFQASQHVVKCMDKLQKKECINEFLSILSSSHDVPNVFLKTCFADPPKYVLKKIIESPTKIAQMDVGFKVFLGLFTNEQLENYLAELMLEAASKETLLKNLPQEIPKEKIIELKSQLLLLELNSCEDPKSIILNMLNNCDQDTINLLVLSLLNKDFKYNKSVNSIVNSFVDIMTSKNHINKSFWKFLFNVEDRHLLQLCLEHADLFKLIVKALIDCSKLLRENMSADFFYIDLTYSQLAGIVRKLFTNENLKIEFLDIVNESSMDLEFWENIL